MIRGQVKDPAVEEILRREQRKRAELEQERTVVIRGFLIGLALGLVFML